MHKMIQSMIAVILVLAICLPGVSSVFATGAKTVEQLDKRYWSVQPKYDAAVKDENNQDIIKYGEDTMAIFLGTAYPDAAEAKKKADDYLANRALEINILRGVIMNVAWAYETLGRNKEAKKVYELALPFIEAYGKYHGLDQSFSIILVKNKIKLYDIQVSVYAEVPRANRNTSFKNAKHEPENGVYFGESLTANPEEASLGEKNSSSALIYTMFETESIAGFNYLIESIAKQKEIIQIAWNLLNEGESLAGVLNQRAKIEREAEYLKSLGTPVFLRFGAEMNIWTKPANPKQFIDAFRFVAAIMKEKAPNVAMVWSVNSVSAEGMNYEMFYPGDEYVDWVGISLYTSKYFMGNKEQDENAQAIYLTGKYANPVLMLEPLIKQYGDKKPIMIAEGGVENYSVKNKTDETVWAEPQMRLMYSFLPVIYPQVKAIYYFNKYADTRSPCRYTLFENAKINKQYAELTANSYFIKKGEKAGGVSYKKIAGTVNSPTNAVSLVTYAPYIDKPNLTKTYRLDKNWIGAGDRQKFDFTKYADGLHTLTIEIADSGTILETVTIYVKKNGETVTLSDKPIK